MNLKRKTLNDMVGTKIKFKYQRVTNIIFSCENVKWTKRFSDPSSTKYLVLA